MSCLSIHPSVCMEQLSSHWTDFNETWYLSILCKYVKKLQVSLQADKINGYFMRRPLDIFYHISLISSPNGSYKRCRENQNTHFVFNNSFTNYAVYEIMWKTIVQPDRPQTTIRCVRIACWIPKATNTHSKYVILFASL